MSGDMNVAKNVLIDRLNTANEQLLEKDRLLGEAMRLMAEQKAAMDDMAAMNQQLSDQVDIHQLIAADAKKNFASNKLTERYEAGYAVGRQAGYQAGHADGCAEQALINSAAAEARTYKGYDVTPADSWLPGWLYDESMVEHHYGPHDQTHLVISKGIEERFIDWWTSHGNGGSRDRKR